MHFDKVTVYECLDVNAIFNSVCDSYGPLRNMKYGYNACKVDDFTDSLFYEAGPLIHV